MGKEVGDERLSPPRLCSVEEAQRIIQKAEDKQRQREAERQAYCASPQGKRDAAVNAAVQSAKSEAHNAFGVSLYSINMVGMLTLMEKWMCWNQKSSRKFGRILKGMTPFNCINYYKIHRAINNLRTFYKKAWLGNHQVGINKLFVVLLGMWRVMKAMKKCAVMLLRFSFL
ncbi:hypothetical protein [Scytonema sp. UIC 10036]|uniref:hypothetical protein n=1 Tax=Scytonema sp. UIC 10036 TaxID=2304196 RepID=UPI00325A798D